MLDTIRQYQLRVREWIYARTAPPIIRDLVDFTYRVVGNFSRNDGSHMAAGVAFYAMFALFPLALGTISIAAIFFDPHDVQDRVLDFIERNIGLGSQEMVASNLTAVFDARGILGLIAILGLFWASRAVFGAVHRSMNRSWLVAEKPRFWVAQSAQFGAALGIATLFILSATLGPVGRAIAANTETLFGVTIPWGWVFTMLPLAIALGFFFVVYRFVPDAKVRWLDAVPAAIFATAVFEGAKWGFAFFLANLSRLDIVYGSVTTVVVLLAFFYVVATIVVIGAEISSEFHRSTTSGVLVARGRWRAVKGGLAPLMRREGERSILSRAADEAHGRVNPEGIQLPLDEEALTSAAGARSLDLPGRQGRRRGSGIGV